MKFTDHVEMSDWNGQCLLTVRDVELHDFLDDFFTRHGVEAQVILPSSHPEQLQLLFPSAMSMAAVYQLLSLIGTQEIDRIARINGGASVEKGGA